MLAWSRLKKHWLERELLNRRADRYFENSFCDDGAEGGCGCVKSGTAVKSLSLRKLLRAMTLSELSSLWMAVRSGGARISDCIEAPHSTSATESAVVKALILCYNAFVTPDISADDDLLCYMVPLSWCRLAEHDSGEVDQKRMCCNPYHYGLMASDMASSSSGAIDRADEGQSRASFRQSDASLHDNVEKRGPGECGDDTGFFSDTSGTHDSSKLAENGLPETSTVTETEVVDSPGNRVKPWCHIAYWEENRRSGPLLSVVANTGLVYFDSPKLPSSLARSSLRVASLNRGGDCSDPIRKTRVKIGLGFALFRRKGSIWLYNRSENCIFVRSNTCFRNRTRPLRLKPGWCCRVHQVGATVTRNGEGPEESPTAFISFVKGWGRSYVRPFITCCPCWVQVIFTS